MKKLLLLFSFAALFACSKDDEQAATDKQILLQYIADNNYDATETESGLFYQILEEGNANGERPNLNSTVRVNYKGYFINGDVFDQTDARGATFALTNLIEAWQEGIPLIKEGGKIILFSPSALAYGSTARSGIPANSVLIFEIELREVVQ